MRVLMSRQAQRRPKLVTAVRQSMLHGAVQHLPAGRHAFMPRQWQPVASCGAPGRMETMSALVNWILSSWWNGGILFSSCTLTSACTAPTGMSCTDTGPGGQAGSEGEAMLCLPMALGHVRAAVGKADTMATQKAGSTCTQVYRIQAEVGSDARRRRRGPRRRPR